ncbi:hypothetical protein [Chelativorans sp. YIM 93263]|uniref:hypothetical protein n=1 Tax=Chelativorans sp. YIM 93263 TaxID=2906648 RepID=UPI0023780062|nr:hypothetical protein [Chelativorans sp. YIM 93263]
MSVKFGFRELHPGSNTNTDIKKADIKAGIALPGSLSMPIAGLYEVLNAFRWLSGERWR